MFRVGRPRVDFVRRAAPGQVSIGDHAAARIEPGLLELLNLPLLEAGYRPQYNIPIGIATSAACAILGPVWTGGIYWAGREVEAEFLALPNPRDIVIGEARLAEYSPRLARFEIEARSASGATLLRGTLQLMAMREGRPAGYASGAGFQALRARLAEAKRPAAISEGALSLVSAPRSVPLGKTATIEVELLGSEPTEVSITLPYGAGFSLEGPATAIASPRAAFVIRADRPDEVNLGRPWIVTIAGAGASLEVPIAVPDPEPGRVFYLLTEDCETFDGGPRTGDYRDIAVCGNQNNFMDPEEYRIQMIRKPERMNQIAERHGARWTHFFCATQRFAVDWAAERSSTGEWPRIAADLDASVRRGAALHEYAPHIHFDYEPDSPLPPQPRLVYDAATDGILPNDYFDPQTNPTHCYHDWDGSARGIDYIKTLGDWTQGSTKAGSLRKSTHFLARLQAGHRYPIVGRTGSHDFGKSSEDQAVSTAAYLANGLRGNSDAYRHAAPPQRGGHLFWCAESDRQQPIADLRQARLVQMCITMDTALRSAAEMNEWFAKHWPTCQGPGVHALLFTTHAMFMRGEPDPFRSLEGGAFDELDRHLEWVRASYPDVEFATASEAIVEFLDYYTPVLEAYVEPRMCAPGRFPVRLLGRGIRVSPLQPATVIIAAPPWFAPDDIRELRVLSGDDVLERSTGCSVTVTLSNRETPLVLEVVLHADAAADFFDPPEPPLPDLLRVRPPVAVAPHRYGFSADLARLLMNPMGGHPEPLGRRVHPIGAFSIGAAITAAVAECGPGSEAAALKLRWTKPVETDLGYVAECRELAPDRIAVKILDDWSDVVAEAEVRIALRAPASPAPDEYEETLRVYRGQRAWKTMLFVRKAYALLLTRGWTGRIEFLRWIGRMLTGGPAGLEEFELQFPSHRTRG